MRRLIHFIASLAVGSLPFLATLQAQPADPHAASSAQNPLATLPQDRITEQITTRVVVPLKNNVHPQARPENDLGVVPADFKMSRMTLGLRRSADQQSAMDALASAQQDPRSPLYHQWLTPDVFGAHFGLSKNDLDKIVNWLKSEGFTIDAVPAGHSTITFSGMAAQVEAAFQAPIHYFRVNNELHYANAGDPQLPRALAGLIYAVEGLHNIRPQPGARVLRPKYNGGNGTHFMEPSDFATIYNLNPLYAAGINGTGTTVGVIEPCTIGDSSVIYAFESLEGLPEQYWYQNWGNVSDCTNTPLPELDEAYLDYEWAAAVARNAKIVLVAADSVFDALNSIVNDTTDRYDVLSVSYYDCEANMGTSNQLWANVWQMAHMTGIVGVSISGDSGAAACDFPPSESSASHGQGVSGFCTPIYTVCVGGTELNEGSNASLYWSPTGAALGYIPEVAWNESGANGGAGLWSSGGGYSTLYAKPSWQTGNSNAYRGVPDLAFSAAAHDGYRVCDTAVSDCSNSSGDYWYENGTSAAAPVFAGMMALVVQQAGRQGSVLPSLYALAARTNVTIFHDVVSGSNSVPGQGGYSAGPEWDPVTGLGSVDANAMVRYWSLPTPTGVEMTKSPPPASGCTAPTSTSAFVTTDSTAYLFFNATVTATDRLSNDWLAPNGDVSAGNSWNPSAGTYCFIGASLSLSNQPLAHLGTWAARIYDNGTQIASVSFTLSSPPAPAIALSTNNLQFTYTIGANVPPVQTVAVSNTGGGTLTWSAVSNNSWLLVSAASNSLTVSVNPAGLSPGAYSGSIAVTAPGASNSPQAINVTLNVTGAASSSGVSRPGIFRAGFFWLLDVNGTRQPDRAFAFGGIAGDIPITGDWSGSGTTKVGIYRASNGLFLLDWNGDGVFDPSVDKVYNLGVGTQPGDVPVVGDWNGDGRSKVGIFRQGFFWILDTNGDGSFGAGDQSFAFGGVSGDVPVVGDWTGTGTSKVGVFRAGYLWILDTAGNHTVGQAFPFGGSAGDIPIVGDWNGDGRGKAGIFRGGFLWILDTNGSQSFTSGVSQVFAFGGIAGDKPVVGKWASTTPSAPTLTGFTISPTTVNKGDYATLSFTLSAPAPTGGAIISLSANNSGLPVPQSYTVSAGQSSGSFQAQSSAVITSTTTSTVTASYNGGSQTASITVNVVSAQKPTVVTGSASAVTSNSATLNGTVNPNGLDTQYWFLYGTSSSLAGAAQTGTYDVGAGTSTLSISGNAPGLSANTLYYYQLQAQNSAGTITGSILTFTSGGAVPPTPTGLSPGGSSSPGATVSTLTPTLTWSQSAGAQQYSVAVLKVSTGATVAAQTVSTTSFNCPTLENGATYIWSVSASNLAGTSSASTGVYFTVMVATPPTLTGFTISPTTVNKGDYATLSFTLSAAAPTGGALISLSANNSGFPVPQSYTVSAGQSSGSFQAQSSTVISSTTTTTVTASYNGGTETASITVDVTVIPALTGFSISPATVTGGSYATLSFTLSGAAPAGGAAIGLSSNSSAFSVPSSYMIPAGQSAGSFSAQATIAVATGSAATVTATYNGASRTAGITVNKFADGFYVLVSGTGGTGLNLRNCANTTCYVIVTMPEGTLMQVIGGPVSAGGYTWWNLTGVVNGIMRTGWAVENYLSQ